MAEIRGDFHERSEDEAALQHAGMRHLKFGSGDGVMAVEKDVQIDQARTFGERLFAAHGRFDGAELVQ